jgi:(1->4)-alpha-D-glucan 1-alpha-D-glucosylmutase
VSTQIPIATYRLQFTRDFDFARCMEILEYLRDLGISHIYASPIFKARPGSTHGYDVCDHNEINPELGGMEGFRRLREKTRGLDIGWIQDIVPNHMAVSGDNPLLVDVLENGPHSRYLPFFDIDWDHPDTSIRGRMLAPFLGSFLSEALDKREVRLGHDREGFFVGYYTLRLPVRIESYGAILTRAMEVLRERHGMEEPDLTKLQGVISTISTLDTAEPQEGRYELIAFIKQLLHELQQSSGPFRTALQSTLEDYNTPQNGLLHELLLHQHFRLSFWKVAGEEINYRRFFSINELISLRVEEEAVFAAIHKLTMDLVRSGEFSGLRIDHIDGLYDPGDYLERLRSWQPGVYTLVEKILGPGEPLPEPWPVHGTTGYEFMNMVCSLFVQAEHERFFTRVYRRFSGLRTPFPTLVREKKELIIRRHMTGDVDNLARLIKWASSMDLRGSDIAFHSLRRAIAQVLAAFPVYRTYISDDVFREEDRSTIEQAVSTAARVQPDLDIEIEFLNRFLQLEYEESLPEEERRQWLRFAMRFQQFTGPLMAKGYEDTALYVMNRLLCLNEVGGWPDRFGITPGEWARFASQRAERWPHGLNATATHDTKRGEDARLRLAALSELPQEWAETLVQLSRRNLSRKTRIRNLRAPDRNDEYFLYQTLLASWPMAGDEHGSFRERLAEYLVKAVREAKVHSGWIKTDEDYEQALLSYAHGLLDDPEASGVGQLFLPLQQRTAWLGMVYSLGQVLLKITAPGVPDFYQGTELWDLSFVDPDNRRAVDFELRASMLETISSRFANDRGNLLRNLLSRPEDGMIKLFVIWRALQARRQQRRLFEQGGCAPLRFSGEHRDRALGLIRSLGGNAAVAVLPRHAHPLCGQREFPMGECWGDTTGRMPEALSGEFVDAFTGERFALEGEFQFKEVLARFPIALLVSRKTG